MMFSERRADLHLHSYYSDGTSSPVELVQLAASKGLFGLAITDHDTIDGYREAVVASEEKRLILLPGIEISSKYENEELIHVLGYSFDPNNSHLVEMCRIHQRRREERIGEILDKLAALGLPIALEDVYQTSPNALSYGRPHIALAMMKRGYVSSCAKAFSLYLKSGCPAYVEGPKWTLDEAISGIHRAGGFAVLAHPHLIKNRSIVSRVLTSPFDGLEAYYDSRSNSENLFWVKIAEKRGLFVTGGSDFHGAIKPDIPLGGSWTPYETFEMLQKRFNQNMKLDFRIF